jgi:hypothetical protein
MAAVTAKALETLRNAEAKGDIFMAKTVTKEGQEYDAVVTLGANVTAAWEWTAGAISEAYGSNIIVASATYGPGSYDLAPNNAAIAGFDPANPMPVGEPMTRVEIGYTRIHYKGIPLPLSKASHTFVILTDLTKSDGAAYATRAGPTPGAKDYGSLMTTSADWTKGFVDSPAETVRRQFVGTLNISISDAQARVKAYAAFIDDQGIKYVAQPSPGGTGANSNSYAFSFVDSLGFPDVAPLKGIAAPGWNVPLPVPTPAPMPGPIP